MLSESRQVTVVLEQEAVVDVAMGLARLNETITVAAETPLLDGSSATIRSAFPHEIIRDLPVGQGYRDLLKLIPAVQYSEDAIRGPSAGGHGQDNVYLFDGVNVTRPFFGTLSSEPSSHDIEQISVIKGGAKAADFNRAGGFTIDSVSKSGTTELTGQLSFQIQRDGMAAADRTGGVEFDQDKSWSVASLGGPIMADRMFFYGSYYRPTLARENRATRYGAVPDFRSTREELFGKLTVTPDKSILLHGSYRDSTRQESGNIAGAFAAATTSSGFETDQQIAIVEGSWVIDDQNFATLKWSTFNYDLTTLPDRLLDLPIAVDGSVKLDVNHLDRQGELIVPTPFAGQNAYNAFIAPLIERYGFLENGVRTGGGRVGVAGGFGVTGMSRRSAQIGYDFTFGGTLTHDVHLGYQRYLDSEDIRSMSNGWGTISVPGGRIRFRGQPVYYLATFGRQTLGEEVIPTIHSEFLSENIEINDVLRWQRLTVSAGTLISRDTFYGQGLREDRSALSGFVAAPGHKYQMYQVPFSDMIQPRIGATWAYGRGHSVSAGWSRYHPAVSSLSRAASWDRLFDRAMRAYFDADGNLIGADPVSGTSGKLFQEGLKPRGMDEYVIGSSHQLTRRWTARAYARHRYASNFWEDTNNDARLLFNPPEGVPRELYIPDLDAWLAQIGSGTNYVIAELDGAFTKYWEVSLESEWRTSNTFLRGSYSWSHYYGNFDQDNTTSNNDLDIFVGSSLIADGGGRQLWNNRYGDLRGDRRHMLKLYGVRTLGWNASAGIFAVYQSGQPWEAWSIEPYRDVTNDTSATGRFAEPAGSRRSDDHYQLDLNYTQRFDFAALEWQLALDVFNVTNRQTGYNINPAVAAAGFGLPRTFFDPRRLQIALRLGF